MVEKEWIEACQIEQNSSMETARRKLRTEQLAEIGKYDDLVVRSGNRYAIVSQDTELPQCYEIATINQRPMLVRNKSGKPAGRQCGQ